MLFISHVFHPLLSYANIFCQTKVQPGSVGDVGQPESGVGSMEETEPEAATEITLVMVGDVLLAISG